MALFSRKTKKEEVKEVEVAAPVSEKSVSVKSDVTHVLRNPRITEKASMHMEGGCYVFDIAPRANKRQVAAAMLAYYKVTPRKVAIVNIRSKTTRNMRTGQSGVKGGGKKAYVYLKKGETITIN